LPLCPICVVHRHTYTKVEKLHHMDKNTSLYVINDALMPLLGSRDLSKAKFSQNVKALGIIRSDQQVVTVCKLEKRITLEGQGFRHLASSNVRCTCVLVTNLGFPELS
jgi:hypothetical protein